MRGFVVQTIAVLLALTAVGISFLLLRQHVTGDTGPGWFEAACHADAPDANEPPAAGEAPSPQAEEGDADTDDADADAEPEAQPAEPASAPPEGAGLDDAERIVAGEAAPITTASGQRGRDCNAVLKSDYGVWPPKRADDPPGKAHVPVAYLGMVYYSFLAVWLVGVGRPSRDRWWLHFFPVGMVLAGLGGSAYFMWIMFTVSEAWCFWCLMTHIINVLIAVCLVLLWPCPFGAKKAAVAAAAGDSGEGTTDTTATAPAVVSHPTFRQVLITVLAMLIALYGHTMLQGMYTQWWNQQITQSALTRLENRMKGDGKRMLSRWSLQEKYDIQLRPDDPVHPYNHSEESLLVVVFSDFQCPHCREVAKFLHEEVTPLFDDHLRVVFKHFPLNSDCNPHVKTKLHQLSCYTSAMAEAARMQGGNDAFWTAHDYLFEHQREVKQYLPIAAFSEALGLDAERVKEDMRKEETLRRIYDDTDEGKRIGLRATPSIYANGRYVETAMVRELRFWDALADQYWRVIKKPRPEHTKLSAQAKKAAEQGQAGSTAEPAPKPDAGEPDAAEEATADSPSPTTEP